MDLGAAADDLLALVITYRQRQGSYEQVCLQVYRAPARGVFGILNPDGVVRERVGADLYRPADEWLSMIYAPVRFFGQRPDVVVQERAFRTSLRGDLTLLREQTVEPLYLLAVLPRAGRLLPGSLNGRVDSLVVDARLAFGQWRGTVEFLTPTDAAAEQVGLVVAVWRDLAGSLAGRFASSGSGQSLRASLDASSVEVAPRRVIASVMLEAPTLVRVSKELVGHGPPEKVTICHKGHTLLVSQSAVPAHLAHGDTLGPCPGTGTGGPKGNNGLGNGVDPQPPGNPPPNDVPGL